MGNGNRMERLCDWYIRCVAVVGAFYCIVPAVIWFGGMFVLLPFRSVYVLRLVLSLAIGPPLAAWANRFALRLWLIKHRSNEGPATVLDGAAIGAAAGMATALLPPLTALIGTNHPMQARTFIILSWLAAIAIGALFGGTLAALGRAYLKRNGPADGRDEA